MATRRWRCSFCKTHEFPWGFEFEAEQPKCPNCKAFGMAVIPLVNVHLYAPDPNGPIGGAGGRRYRVACQPTVKNPKGVPCSGHPDAVTCPECKKTHDFQEMKEAAAAITGGILLE